MDRWAERNSRFQRDQDLYRLTQPTDIKALTKADIIVLPDPKTLVRKVSALIARHPNVIEVPPAPGIQDPMVAQMIENFLYSWDQAINQRWMLGLHAPYRFDQAFFSVLRGWICERTMLRPEGEEDISGDPSALWDHQIFDPANIFPFVAGNEVRRVTHAYKTTVAELQADPLFGTEARKQYEDIEGRNIVNIRCLYWKDYDGGWWYACLGGASQTSSASYDGEFLAPPRELGYNPWTITIGKGAAYRDTEWDDMDYLKEIGTGILDESAENQRYMNRMATRLSELLSLESNPPLTITTKDGKLKKITFDPGSRNYLLVDEKVEAHRIGPALGDYQLLWDILSQRAARAGLPTQFFGEFGGESGFSAATLLAAGRDILFPFVEAVNQADALKYRKVLEIYRDFGPAQSIRTKLQPNGLGVALGAEITPQMIRDQGTFIEITREDMTPQEYATRVNLALAQIKEKVISLERARKDLGIRNPAAENLKVLSEMVYLDPGVIKALVPHALEQSGGEFLRKTWEMVQNTVPPMGVGQPGQPGQMPPGPPQGPPGQMPPQGPPPDPTQQGLPGEVMPPIAGGNMLMNTQVAQQDPAMAQMNQLLAMLNGGAQGGAGGGGIPPVPGQGSPIPQFLPPGRGF